MNSASKYHVTIDLGDDVKEDWKHIYEQFTDIITNMGRRTIFCPQDLEQQVLAIVAKYGMEDLFKVRALPWGQDDKIFVVDEEAIMADWDVELTND